jgi:hypothetical protein
MSGTAGVNALAAPVTKNSVEKLGLCVLNGGEVEGCMPEEQRSAIAARDRPRHHWGSSGRLNDTARSETQHQHTDCAHPAERVIPYLPHDFLLSDYTCSD